MDLFCTESFISRLNKSVLHKEKRLFEYKSYLLLPAPKQYLVNLKFEDDREEKMIVTRWLITQGTDFCEQGTEKFIHKQDKYPHV